LAVIRPLNVAHVSITRMLTISPTTWETFMYGTGNRATVPLLLSGHFVTTFFLPYTHAIFRPKEQILVAGNVYHCDWKFLPL
jgi:hypothetical protein